MNPKTTPLRWGLSILLAFLSVAFLGLFAFRATSRSVQALARANHEAVGVFVASLIQREFSRAFRLASAFASTPATAQTRSHNQQEILLDPLHAALSASPAVECAALLDLQGTPLRSYPAPPSLPAPLLAAWRTAGQPLPGPKLSPVYYGRSSPRRPLVAILAPVQHLSQGTVAILLLECRLDDFLAPLGAVTFGQDSQLILLDSSGRLAFHPFPDALDASSNSYATLPLVQQALDGDPVTGQYVDPVSGQEMIASFTPVKLAGRHWVVIAQQPLSQAYGPLSLLAAQLGAASALLAAAAAGIVWILGRGNQRIRRLNRQLRDQNQQLRRYESIVRSSSDAIISTTLQGQILDWNPAAETICGYPAAEMENQSLALILRQEHSHELQTILDQIRHGRKVVNHHTQILLKAGFPIDVAITASPIRDQEGQIAGACLLARDITETKRTEENLAQERFLVDTLMEHIPDHIYFKDQQSRFLRVNPAMAKLVKLQSPGEACGKTDFDFFTAEHAERAFADEQEILRTGEPMVNRVEKETWPDGSVTWASTTKQCLRDKTGRIIGTFGISRDVTARKRAEDALAQKALELARSNKELEQFAYAASHDLQEPLRMIASYTQLLARRYRHQLDSEAQEFIQYAVDGALRMQGLINDLLAYSRLGTRGKPFVLTGCNEILQRVIANLTIAIEEHHAEIQVSPLPHVFGDATQLTQLFQNLISNGIKFHGSRPPLIEVSATSRTQPNPGLAPAPAEWLFAVRDNGIGIDPRHFERIFAIFQRLHTRDRYPGSGIGLALCKKIVERHGGRIWVESEPGKGAVFLFTIPQTENKTAVP